MKILNLGSLEIMFILILALIILGPGRIVNSARSIGIWLRTISKTKQWNDILSTAHEVREFPRKIMQETGLDESINEIKQLHMDMPFEETQTILNLNNDLHLKAEKDEQEEGG